MWDSLRFLKRGAVEFFFPAHCVGCGREGVFLCTSCRRLLLPLLPPMCEKCSGSLSWEGRCPNCQRWQLQIDGIRSAFRFEGVLREAILQLKYRHTKALAPTLGQLLAEHLSAKPVPVDVIVPVPLHWRRFRERGYNQSALLARELGGLIDKPVVETTLERVRPTTAQTKATAELRRNNVMGAFACRDQRLRLKHILLIDDVATTGATLDSCALALKQSGVASTWGLTLAREI